MLFFLLNKFFFFLFKHNNSSTYLLILECIYLLVGDDDEDMKFFYTREEPEIMQRGMRMKRVCVAGVWRERGEEPILSLDTHDVIAMKRTYTFERTGGQRTANQPRATWTMYEYRLVRTDTLNQHLSRIADANVHIYILLYFFLLFLYIK